MERQPPAHYAQEPFISRSGYTSVSPQAMLTAKKQEGFSLAFLNVPASPRPPHTIPSLRPFVPPPTLQLCIDDPLQSKPTSRVSPGVASLEKGMLKDLVDQLYKQGMEVDPDLYVNLLRLCGDSKAILMGILVHDHIVASGLGDHTFLGNLVLQMYGKCRALEQARSVFDRIQERTTYSWNLMISSYIKWDECEKAFELFHHMWCSGEELNEVTMITILNGCSNEAAISNGRLIHSCVVEHGFECDMVVVTAIINMYGRCKCVHDAERTFDKLLEQDVIAWNSIIGLHAQQKQASDGALKAYRQMQKKNMSPDHVTFIILLEACAALGNLMEGRLAHAGILDAGFNEFVTVRNALVSMYSKCGSFEDADIEFKKMHTHNVVSWNTIIAVYTQYGYAYEGIELYKQMVQLGFEPDDFTFSTIISACAFESNIWDGARVHAIIVDQGLEMDAVIATALIDMYSKCKCLEDARKVFDGMHPRTVHVWTVMIGAYMQHGNGVQALGLFRQMQLDGVKPDEITFASALGACAILSDLNEGKRIHERIRRLGFETDIVVGGALVNMYGKCGSMTDAQIAFDEMSEHDLISWNALVMAYGQQGVGELTLEIISKMQAAGVEPNEVTFVSAISACSHAGLVDEGVRFFDSMQHVHAITPTVEHYGCMVDLYGRAGYLKEAEDVIKSMPFEPDTLIWETLLGACHIYGDVERGKCAAEHAIQLNSQNDAPFVLLSNIYAAEGRWDDVARVRKKMIDLGVKKKTGYSTIEVDDKLHKFVARDRLHPQADEIYRQLERLISQLKEAGYVPNTRLVLHDVDEELKEHLLWYHSEKLAVTFGLMSTAPGAPLRIIKNLRICQDCHSAFTIISKLAGREISLRDANRFHHFSNGLCSCKDYW